jgi:hypothetical protein
MEEKLQRGVALVVTMILLLMLSVLVVMSVGTANAELVMAGNEQHMRDAVNAAATGVEHAIARLGSHEAPGNVEGKVGDVAYEAVIRVAGEEAHLLGMSTGKFIGRHYEIESTGYGVRGAFDAQVQGVLVTEAAFAARTFVQHGGGLQEGAGS